VLHLRPAYLGLRNSADPSLQQSSIGKYYRLAAL